MQMTLKTTLMSLISTIHLMKRSAPSGQVCYHFWCSSSFYYWRFVTLLTIFVLTERSLKSFKIMKINNFLHFTFLFCLFKHICANFSFLRVIFDNISFFLLFKLLSFLFRQLLSANLSFL